MTGQVVAGFEWDKGNRIKCEKHGVSIKEIEAVFCHPHRIAPDIRHSQQEVRYIVIGKGDGARWIFVVMTLRELEGQRLIRPVSARYMHDKEARSYEEDIARS